MIDTLQIYISDSFDPYENLATEKYLLDTTGKTSLTLYLWQNQSTVVIGRNQNPWAECRCSLLEEEGGKLARRLSGGGAVFHDLGNLNFTFLCSSENYDLEKHLEVIKTACSLAGISAEISGRNDILSGGRKFSGNAFYNSKGKSYHHGTLLISADMEKMARYLTPSKAKLWAKGVKSVKSRTVNLCELSPKLTCSAMAEYMAEAFREVYSLPLSLLSKIDSAEISALVQKYKSWEYLYGNPMPFSFSCEERFSWGQVHLQLNVASGIIGDARLYTDAMEWNLPHLVCDALTGCRFEITDMQKALFAKLPENMATDFLNLLKNGL